VNPSPQSGRRVGYARVSTDDQNLSLQLDALAQQGVGTDLIFTDKLSGAKDDRPGLGRCLKALKAGDTLIVWRLDRLGRSLRRLVTVIADLREQGVGFRSIGDGMIDTTSASGELVFHIFFALAQFERRLIQERTKAGLAAARARGRKGGRPRLAQTEPRVQLARQLHADGGITLDAICKTLHISRTTYYRCVKAGRKTLPCRPTQGDPPPDAAAPPNLPGRDPSPLLTAVRRPPSLVAEWRGPDGQGEGAGCRNGMEFSACSDASRNSAVKWHPTRWYPERRENGWSGRRERNVF
jgi:DNA invertase Pin-like site-specific DNA recombinase